MMAILCGSGHACRLAADLCIAMISRAYCRHVFPYSLGCPLAPAACLCPHCNFMCYTAVQQMSSSRRRAAEMAL